MQIICLYVIKKLQQSLRSLNPVYFPKCVASCLSLIFFPFETPSQNRTQKSNDKNRLSDIKLQKKNVNFSQPVLELQQEEPMTIYH